MNIQFKVVGMLCFVTYQLFFCEKIEKRQKNIYILVII